MGHRTTDGRRVSSPSLATRRHSVTLALWLPTSASSRRHDSPANGPVSGRASRRSATPGLRAALWMPTLTAVRKNPWLRAYYERLRARGKLPKVALVAAMRKLLIAVLQRREESQALRAPSSRRSRHEKGA